MAKKNQETASTEAVDLVRVKFLKSPTGAFMLGYNAGEEGDVAPSIVEALVESGCAVKL